MVVIYMVQLTLNNEELGKTANKPNIEARVKEILAKYPQAKGDDMILIWRYCQLHSSIKLSFAKFSDLLLSVSFESITRARRKIQEPEKIMVEKGLLKLEDAKYLPTERVLKKRKNLEAENRLYYRKPRIRKQASKKENVYIIAPQ